MNYTRLKTQFEVGDIPLKEYPRPQFVRDSYITLNGKWDYAILRKSENFVSWQGKILVPFSPECLLSGLPDGIMVTPNDVLYYHREFDIPAGFLKAKTFIHFGAVDYECKVSINGVTIGEHTGGYVPFTLDISSVIAEGKNTIDVVVTDPSDTSYHARGKQTIKHGGIWYTPQSGIWQSVWLESVPQTYLDDITIVPDIDNNLVRLTLKKSSPVSADIVVLDGDNPIAIAKGTSDTIEVKLDKYELWSPENPKLYNLAIKVGDDIVKSYFAMRKFSWVRDKKGIKRIGLNNKPYFNTGVLDQGYWSDGMLTPPSNEALEYDVKLIKSMGFNMIRKHIKIEPLLWYYYCDKYGIIVWQDIVSGGTKYNIIYIGGLAQAFNIHIKDDNESAYRKLARAEQESRDEYEKELDITMDYLKNVPSIGLWVPFNEGWGQFDSVRITKHMLEKDPTRIIDSVSGWNDQGKDTSEAKSMHIYFTPIVMPKDDRCLLLSEFGGYSIQTKDHTYSNKKFGYRIYNNPEKYQQAFKKLYEKRIIPNIEKGLSATVYTQVSDVENEINGLVTYDRKVVKMPIELAKELNSQLVIKD